MRHYSFRQFKKYFRIWTTSAILFIGANSLPLHATSCDDTTQFTSGWRAKAPDGEFKTDVWIYTVKSSNKINYKATIASILKKNPRALQPFATCITRPSESWWTRPTYCTNQQGISLQETGNVENTVLGNLTIPSRNGLPFQTSSEETLFVVLCIPRQVFTYSVGKILVGDRQEVQDKIFLSLTIWTPSDFETFREGPTRNDYKF